MSESNMPMFFEFANYGKGSLKQTVSVNVNAIAAIETNVVDATCTLHTVGGKSFSIDAENMKALTAGIQAIKLPRESSE